LNDKTSSAMQVFNDQQALGHLRPDIRLVRRSGDRFPHVVLLTQDSKATAFTRLLFVMKPWYASEPSQLGGLRVVTVADPVAVSRAWALSLLVDDADRLPPDPPGSPGWVRAYAPIFQRFWGDGLQEDNRLAFNEEVLAWARDRPESFKAAAAKIAGRGPIQGDADAERLQRLLVPVVEGRAQTVRRDLLDQLLRARPEGLVEAATILADHPDAVLAALTRYGYTDPASIGGYLDRDILAGPPPARP
jgi:hypothetical protein